jgi:hypothetical protein
MVSQLTLEESCHGITANYAVEAEGRLPALLPIIWHRKCPSYWAYAYFKLTAGERKITVGRTVNRPRFGYPL